jgi:HEAT repeat protein
MSNFDLIQLLKSENQEERKTAAEALGKLGNSDAVPALLEALEKTDSVVEAMSLTNALRDLKDSRAVSALFDLVERCGKWKQNFTSAMAVEHLYSLIATALGNIADKESLIEKLHHPNDKVRRIAADALGSIRII